MKQQGVIRRRVGSDILPRLGKVAAGYALYGKGWAVHGKTREEAWQRFVHSRERNRRLDAEIAKEANRAD